MRLSFVSRSSLRWFLSVAVCCLCWSASVVPQLWRSGCSLRVSSGSLSGLWRYSYKECYGRAKVLKGRHLEHRPVGPHLMFFDFLMSFNSLSPVRTLLCAADATFSLILSSTPTMSRTFMWLVLIRCKGSPPSMTSYLMNTQATREQDSRVTSQPTVNNVALGLNHNCAHYLASRVGQIPPHAVVSGVLS